MKNIIPILIVVIGILSFSSCSEEKTKKAESTVVIPADSIVVKEGKMIAQKSFEVLKGELINAISQGGVVAGVDICNEKAQVLTDSLSKVYGVAIKRTTLKNRNPKNAANEVEKDVLAKWEQDMAQSTKIIPKVLFSDNGEIEFMAPIKMQKLCISCHGDHQYMSEELRVEIEKDYPNDDAHGYKEGDLRGAWSITFPKGYFK